jgi:hypothetical protein
MLDTQDSIHSTLLAHPVFDLFCGVVTSSTTSGDAFRLAVSPFHVSGPLPQSQYHGEH